MLETLSIISANDTLTLNLRGNEELLIENIDGLDPVKASFSSSNFAGLDGRMMYHSSRDIRNIKVRLGMFPNYKVQDSNGLRKYLYRYIMPSDEVTLEFSDTDGLKTHIIASVESVETALFSKDPKVDISFLCFHPDFYNPIVDEVSYMHPGGENLVINYEGTSKTGIRFEFTPSVDIDSFTLKNVRGVETDAMVYEGGLLAGESIIINTVPGEKDVILKDAESNEMSKLAEIDIMSKWILLHRGRNELILETPGNFGGLVAVSYTTKYGGL